MFVYKSIIAGNVAAISRSHIVKIVLAVPIFYAGVVGVHSVEELPSSARQNLAVELKFSVRAIRFETADFAVENPVPAEADFLFPPRSEHIIFAVLRPYHRGIPDVISVLFQSDVRLARFIIKRKVFLHNCHRFFACTYSEKPVASSQYYKIISYRCQIINAEKAASFSETTFR